MDYLHSLPRQAKFRLGSLYVTAAVDRDIDFADVGVALSRHVHGDWGDVCEEDREANEFSLTHGERLLSVYHDRNGVKFWIITERDRSATTVLLPDDY
jgi:hypothetical protein